MAETLPAELQEIREALNSEQVRIEVGTTWSLSQGVLPCARIFAPGATERAKWKQVGPMLLPKQGGTRRDLLDLIAGLVDG